MYCSHGVFLGIFFCVYTVHTALLLFVTLDADILFICVYRMDETSYMHVQEVAICS